MSWLWGLFGPLALTVLEGRVKIHAKAPPTRSFRHLYHILHAQRSPDSEMYASGQDCYWARLGFFRIDKPKSRTFSVVGAL